MSTALGSGDGGQGTAPAAAGNPADGGSAGAAAGAAGGAAASWRDSLPDDIKSNAAITQFKDIASLTKSFIHAQGLIGKKGVTPPDWAKSTPEEQQAFFKSIGVPEVDKYDIPLAKESKVPETVMKAFKEQAVKNGLLPQQAKSMLEWYEGFEKQQLDARANQTKGAQDQALAKLKQEWGDGYDRQVQVARMAVKEAGGDELVKYMDESGMGNDTTLIRAFAKLGKAAFSEDKLRESGVSDSGMTPGDIQSQLAELRAKGNENGLFNKNHPMHAVTMAKMESLAKSLTGGR